MEIKRVIKRLNVKPSHNGVLKGKPSLRDLPEGIPSYYQSSQGITMYVRSGLQMFSTRLDKVNRTNRSLMNLPRPDYDSGLLTISNPITVNHALGHHPLITQLLFTHDSGVTFHYIPTSVSDKTLIESTRTTTIIRKGSSSWGWYYDSAIVDIDDGDGKFRLLLWK